MRDMGRNPRVRRQDIKAYIRRTSRRRELKVSKLHQMGASHGELVMERRVDVLTGEALVPDNA